MYHIGDKGNINHFLITLHIFCPLLLCFCAVFLSQL